GSGYVDTTLSRSIVLSKSADDKQVDVSITINWKNGNTPKSKSYNVSLTNWQAN
ncbi:MAG: hypothetical protein RL687_439, partial [Candidatus Parcubacteria bacterium]